MSGNAFSDLVSVIIPAHNAARFIGASIESARAQTHANIEIIVVDDGSTDGTIAIVQAIAARDARVKLLRQSRRGVAAARNLAIRESRGEFIAPMDADDIWFPRKIEKQLCCMVAAGSSAGLVYAWSVYIDEHGQPTGDYYAHELPRDIHATLIFRNVVGSSSVPLIRRGALIEAGMYNENLLRRDAQGCEDIDLYLRIAERYEFHVVRELLVGYRMAGQLSSQSCTMARSFYHTMLDCQARRPDIPWAVFRWSLARQYLYLHGQARGLREYRQSMKLLLTALRYDPSFLWRWTFYRAVMPNPRRVLDRVRGRQVEVNPAAAPDPQILARMASRSAEVPSGLFGIMDELYRERLAITERLLGEARAKTVDTGKPKPLMPVEQRPLGVSVRDRA
jgi:glycosyltransferase involved in cell wall biosynthesis